MKQHQGIVYYPKLLCLKHAIHTCMDTFLSSVKYSPISDDRIEPFYEAGLKVSSDRSLDDGRKS